MRLESMTQAQVDALGDEDIRTLELATRKLADQTQREAARYQREADRLRKTMSRRRRAINHGNAPE